MVTLAISLGALFASTLSPLAPSQALQISALSPASGGIAGGETVTLTGDFAPSLPTTMQELTQSDCASLPVYTGLNPAAVATLSDPRGDGQSYQVAKLADGNCWMLNNLKLGSTTGPLALTPADTNITAGWSLPQVLADSGVAVYNQPRVDALLAGDGSYNAASPNSAETDITSANFAGYYYNWCAATAGGATTCSNDAVFPVDTSEDICPVGWRLPVGGGATGELAVLNGSMFAGTPSAADTTNDAAHAAKWAFTGPFKGVLAGQRTYSLWADIGSIGYVWSSSHDPGWSRFAQYVAFSASGVDPATLAHRNYRRSIRCMMPSGAVVTPPAAAPTVTIDGLSATVTAWSETSITITTPAHAAGLVDVVVTRGAESVTLVGAYEYRGPTPPPPAAPPPSPAPLQPVVPGVPNTGRPA